MISFLNFVVKIVKLGNVYGPKFNKFQWFKLSVIFLNFQPKLQGLLLSGKCISQGLIFMLCIICDGRYVAFVYVT
jgi:hypothetical protein